MQHQPLPALLLDPTFPYGEDLFQYIWQQGLFDHHALRTTDGRAVEVVKAGRIQVDSGPDLIDAQVRIDGQLWAGTVEVHLRSSDWKAHGHQRDPAYENVVLHVVFEHDAEVRMRSGASPPTVELHSRVSSDSISLYRSLMHGQGFVPCASQIARVDKARIGPWLERVLVERLQRKAREVESLYAKLNHDPAEALYHLLARAFGLKVNAEPFGMLAHALPLKVIQKYRDDALRTEALLFGQAGLLQIDFVEVYPRELQQEHALLARLHGLHPAPVAAWKFTRMRPVNFPTVRIAQFAQLLMRCDGDLGVLLSTDRVQELYDRLDVEASAYWSTHYRFDSESAPRSKRLGRAGAQHLIINAIVPVLFALGRAQGREEMGERALRLLEQLPAERNQLLARWADLGLVADTAARGQALIELKNLYCAKRRCLSCTIGNQLLRSTVK
ncbi:MAG: DUF2851 family protein [Flavobacteriales bacterium]|nr:DUF2851 family protein [Flavobacteriales bacterium]